MDSEAIAGIIGVLLGWGLSQLTDIIRNRYRRDALMEELSDIKERLSYAIRSYEKSIRMYALGGVASNVQLKINNVIFKNHYPDIAIHLRASQRRSYAFIHGYIETVNDGIEQKIEMIHSFADSPSEEKLVKWGDFLAAQYGNVRLAYWHVSYHLQNREFPFLGVDDNEVYESMLKEQRSAKERFGEIVEESINNLDREMFND